MDTLKTLVPIDFNSLVMLEDSTLTLSEYYMDYAFYSEDIVPAEGMQFTFYDKFWLQDPGTIVCLDGTLKKTEDRANPWVAEITGQIYVSQSVPVREYTNAFIGSNTYVQMNKAKAEIQKLGLDPRKDILGGVSSFLFASGSELPKFSSLVGMNIEDLNEFFKFNDPAFKKPIKKENEELADNTIVIRGGRNKVD